MCRQHFATTQLRAPNTLTKLRPLANILYFSHKQHFQTSEQNKNTNTLRKQTMDIDVDLKNTQTNCKCITQHHHSASRQTPHSKEKVYRTCKLLIEHIIKEIKLRDIILPKKHAILNFSHTSAQRDGGRN